MKTFIRILVVVVCFLLCLHPATMPKTATMTSLLLNVGNGWVLDVGATIIWSVVFYFPMTRAFMFRIMWLCVGLPLAWMMEHEAWMNEQYRRDPARYYYEYLDD